jgi:hypothetical protein
MGLFDAYGAPTFGLNDCKIATLNSDGTYASAVDVPSVQLYEINPQTVNAQLEGDDSITDSHANVISARVRIRFGSINFEALQVLLGKNYVQSNSTPNRKKTITVDNLKFPYFGIVGKALSTQDAGSTVIFVAKVKIMEGFTVSMQYGQYAIPELTCMAIKKNDGQGIFQMTEWETDAALAIPPATT